MKHFSQKIIFCLLFLSSANLQASAFARRLAQRVGVALLAGTTGTVTYCAADEQLRASASARLQNIEPGNPHKLTVAGTTNKKQMSTFNLDMSGLPLGLNPMRKIFPKGEKRGTLEDWKDPEIFVQVSIAQKVAFERNNYFKVFQPKETHIEGGLHPDTLCHGSIALSAPDGEVLVVGSHNPFVSGPLDWVSNPSESFMQSVRRNLKTQFINEKAQVGDSTYYLSPLSLKVPIALVHKAASKALENNSSFMCPLKVNCLTFQVSFLLFLNEEVLAAQEEGAFWAKTDLVAKNSLEVLAAIKHITHSNRLGTLNYRPVIKQIEKFLSSLKQGGLVN